jgi:hypothetical protein
MWFKHRAWIPIAWFATFASVLSVFFAAREAEPWHALIHGATGVLFALGAQRLANRPRAGGSPDSATGESRDALDAMQHRLGEMEERLDFTERLLAKHREADRSASPPR